MAEIYEKILRLDSTRALVQARRANIRMDAVTDWLAEAPSGKRLDAVETANLARALLYLRAQSIDIEYHTGQFRDVLPINTAIPLGAETYGVKQYDIVGEAEFISSYSDDLQRVDAFLKENTIKIQSTGLAYEYSVQEILACAMSGSLLDQMKQQAVRDGHDRKHDRIACVGDAKTGLVGFAKHPDVVVVALANAGTWQTKSDAFEGYKIYADVIKLLRNIVSDTKGMHRATRIAMDSLRHELLNTTVMSTTDSRSVREALAKSYPKLDIVEWERLATADAANTGPRIVAFENRNDIVEYLAPGGGYTEQPAQNKNLATVVNTWARTAGVGFYRPKAGSYMDGV